MFDPTAAQWVASRGLAVRATRHTRGLGDRGGACACGVRPAMCSHCSVSESLALRLQIPLSLLLEKQQTRSCLHATLALSPVAGFAGGPLPKLHLLVIDGAITVNIETPRCVGQLLWGEIQVNLRQGKTKLLFGHFTIAVQVELAEQVLRAN